MSIRLLVGLGNPGAEYRDTRHNAGFWLLDRLAAERGLAFRAERAFKGEVCRWSAPGGECWLLKPTTFMNRSGESVQALAAFYKLARPEILVVHDELDLPPGAARLKQGGGHGGHNGLRDLIARLGGADFWRLRLGIGHPGDREQVVGYVLARPSAADARALEETIDFVLPWLPRIAAGDFQHAMNVLHRRAVEPPAAPTQAG